MRLYAVCIGDAGLSVRYVCYHPDFEDWNATKQTPPHAVTDDYQRARKMRQQILASCGHKSVYIVRFNPASRARQVKR